MMRDQHYQVPLLPSARQLTDLIHHDVKNIVGNSPLVRQSNGIDLVHRQQLVVTELLGQGAFSVVHAVTYTNQYGQSGRYALKHLKGKLVSEPDNFRLAAAELAVEAHMLASFDHPNIIKIRGWAANGVASYCSGRHDGFFLMLDCLEETLEQRVDMWKHNELIWREKLNPHTGVFSDMWRRFGPQQSDVAQLAHDAQQQRHYRDYCNEQYLQKLGHCAEVASALRYLHEKGVIFRDLKPNNIGFLNGRVKLFDFGLSRELPSPTLDEPFQMSGKVGTLRYMAVEVACHQPYNVSADVYSWAMVCYEMLTLQKPFAGWTRDMHQNLVCGQGARPALVSEEGLFHLAPDMQKLLAATWNQHSHRRPCISIVQDMVQRLEEQQLLLQQQTDSFVVELPQDFSISRKSPLRSVSTFTEGTVSMSAESMAGL